MVNPILYFLHMSPPCRAVELTAKALGLHLDLRVINLMAGDHLKSEYLKMNPRHTIPLLDDNGTIIPESHAIMIYLASKYGKDDSLYPKDLAKQSKGKSQRCCREIPPAKAEEVRKAYQLLEDTLVEDYVAGSSLTIGDFSCISSVSSVMGFIPIDRTKFPRIHGWITRLKELPYYEEANGSGATQLTTELLKLIEKRN
ncbi:hypothetical protein pipiens_010597 [Culex pipiens pipiens]|uniref:glutathione transferase n=1 Tax=Culex pipiens pipiens TaxID=38569 RepID=A0ABD1D9I9_CULPP